MKKILFENVYFKIHTSETNYILKISMDYSRTEDNKQLYLKFNPISIFCINACNNMVHHTHYMISDKSIF